VKRGVENLDLSAEYGDDEKIINVVTGLPLPVYGSKPETLEPLLHALTSKLSTTGATIAATGYAGLYHGPYMLAATLTGAFVVWFTTPFVKTFRTESHELFEEWTKQKLRGGDHDNDDEGDDH
jgi:hypothetical protein